MQEYFSCPTVNFLLELVCFRKLLLESFRAAGSIKIIIGEIWKFPGVHD